jgi:hypothetical protein
VNAIAHIAQTIFFVLNWRGEPFAGRLASKTLHRRELL